MCDVKKNKIKSMSHLLLKKMRSDGTRDLNYRDILPIDRKRPTFLSICLIVKTCNQNISNIHTSELVHPSRLDWQKYKETRLAHSFSHRSQLECLTALTEPREGPDLDPMASALEQGLWLGIRALRDIQG